MSDRIVNVGLIQAACSPDPATNLHRTLAAAERAAGDGAQIICTQELFRSQYFCQSEDYQQFQLAEPIPGPTTQAFQELAKAHSRCPQPPEWESEQDRHPCDEPKDQGPGLVHDRVIPPVGRPESPRESASLSLS